MLANRLRYFRAKKRITQEMLAAMAGISRASLALFESGHGDPKLSTLIALAAALRIEFDELLEYNPFRCECGYLNSSVNKTCLGCGKRL